MKTTTTSLLVIVALCVAGCRTAGPQVVLRDCRHCAVRVAGDVDAAQGKTVEGELSPGRAVSAAVQASDNAVPVGGGSATVTDSGASKSQTTPTPTGAESESPGE
jgi:hypothetical protein